MEIPPIAVLHESRSDATARLFADRRENPADRERIEEELVRINMRVAADATRRFRNRGIATDDLEQVAYVGLVKAVKGFDPDRGHDFLSFAIPTIRGEVRRHFRDLGWTVRPPRSIQETQTKILGCEGELTQQLGRAPRPSEIAAHLGLDLDLVIEALGASGCFAPVSLDATLGEDDDALTQRLGHDDGGFDVAEARAVLAPLLAQLTPRERKIVEMRFGRGCTQAEIGKEIGVTQMQVSRLLARLMTRMRHELSVPRAA
ncbi:sigma-70 family RNA polymerase sigma factor [Nocardioides sp. YIM 152315]|uniref:sigma-70 family RNA polymerase sigma factor n=1 Tax=Nocardioides sp. YIM 152315 TaxID=3031760 RepID=UPI0023DCADC3|nr:sigma-70 family RNA polymerase sigma factor [Nocardioides sp. YIM 152315]MDF1605684.1 sigma-70 family RNA polymerase sigma factor [Nocardioides sp. YIM 152315]